MTRILAALCLVLAAGGSRAGGMKLERDRLVNLESADTVGFTKTRFDFQHGFKNETLLPVADLTLIFGVWDNVQIEGEGVYHNFKDEFGPGKTVFGFNISEATVKWAPLDQSREDLFSLAVGAGIGQSHFKVTFVDWSGATVLGTNTYLDTLTAYAVATYALPWVVPTLSLRGVAYGVQADHDPLAVQSHLFHRLLSPGGTDLARPAALVPGVGLRLRAYESKGFKAHVVGDYQLTTFDRPTAETAWGAGVQFMYQSPHIMMLYVSNTHADSAAESVFGGPDMFAGFRWSYRF